MHQNAFGGRAPPGPAGGAHSAPPDPLAVFGEGRGLPRKGRGKGRGKKAGKGKKGEGEKMEKGERRGGKGGRGKGVCPLQFLSVPPLSNSWRRPWYNIIIFVPNAGTLPYLMVFLNSTF